MGQPACYQKAGRSQADGNGNHRQPESKCTTVFRFFDPSNHAPFQHLNLGNWSVDVLQLETAAGAAIKNFAGAVGMPCFLRTFSRAR